MTYRQSIRDDLFTLAVINDAPGIALIRVTALKFETRMGGASRANAIEFAKFMWGPIPTTRRY
jgi:hypothetical protein